MVRLGRLWMKPIGPTGFTKTGETLLVSSQYFLFPVQSRCGYRKYSGKLFFNQLSVHHPIEYSAIDDFRVGKHIFEIGGKSKSQN